MNSAYFFPVSKWCRCALCLDNELVKTGADIDCEEDDLESAGEMIREAIKDQKEADGWDGEYCPECRVSRAKEIAELVAADDYEPEGAE